MPLKTDEKIIHSLKKIVGPNWVLTQPADLYMYSFDSALDKSLPAAVVLPGAAGEVSKVISLLHQNSVPFVARGAATSLCGGPVPLNGAVVLSLTRLKKIHRIDSTFHQAVVDPGVVNLRLQQEAEKSGLFYGPDPGSQKACTLGGNVATNAGGPHCLKYGVTSDSIEALDWILPDGTFLTVKKDDPGYDVTGFLVGSEGTLGVATRITVKLLPKPKFIRTMVVSFPSMETAIQSVSDIIAAGILPATLEAMDATIIEAVEAFSPSGYPLDAEAVLLIEVDGSIETELDDQIEKIKALCEKNQSFFFKYAKDEVERAKLWEGRRGSYAAMARLAPNVLVEDGAVPRTKLPQALAKIKEIGAAKGLQVALLFHAGDGNLHPQIIFDERDKHQTEVVKEAGYQMLKACVDLGGTISGEHGVGIDKREAMKWLFTKETLGLFRRLKKVFDPKNLSNPDKLIPLVSQKTPPSSSAQKPNLPGNDIGQRAFVTPASREEFVGSIQALARQKNHFGVRGTGSKFLLEEALLLETKNLNRVLDHDKGNLTVTVEAGKNIVELRSELEAAGQYLWVAGEGTVGGVVASRASRLPELRSQILGMTLALPTGDVVQVGAKTMKNVAGYDVSKLLIGSWGTLAVILDVTFRLMPYPTKRLETNETVPFVMRDIHKKIKEAFDPHKILMPRTSMLDKDLIEHLKRKFEVEKERLASGDTWDPNQLGDGRWF